MALTVAALALSLCLIPLLILPLLCLFFLFPPLALFVLPVLPGVFLHSFMFRLSSSSALTQVHSCLWLPLAAAQSADSPIKHIYTHWSSANLCTNTKRSWFHDTSHTCAQPCVLHTLTDSIHLTLFLSSNNNTTNLASCVWGNNGRIALMARGSLL